MAAAGSDQNPEVFEIDDFTIATLKEGLSAELEQLLRKWELINNKDNCFVVTQEAVQKTAWISKSEEISICNNKLLVSHYWPNDLQRTEPQVSTDATDEVALDDCTTNAAKLLSSSVTDFCPGSIICNQYGVLEFMLLTPVDWDSDKISDENQLRELLSVANETAGKAGCTMPIFIQYGERERQYYFGVCQNNSIRTSFEAIHKRLGHPLRSHLSGFIEMFKENFQSSLVNERNMRTSMQVDYVLQDRQDKTLQYKIESQWGEWNYAKDLYCEDASRLPFGAIIDPIEEFGMSAVWSDVPKGLINEDQNHCIDPLRASSYKSWVSIRRTTSYFMSSYLRELLNLAKLKGKSRVIVDEPNYYKVKKNEASSSQATASQEPSRISDDENVQYETVQRWINEIFQKTKHKLLTSSENKPDLEFASESSHSMEVMRQLPGPGSAVKLQNVETETGIRSTQIPPGTNKEIFEKILNIIAGYKSAPENSLACRISIALTSVLQTSSYLEDNFSQLWKAILYELYKYYTKNQYIPCVDLSAPDLSACKLHQNLQLMQCAVDAKKRHDSKDVLVIEKLFFDSDDEFFDAQETMEKKSPKKSTNFADVIDIDGRLRPFGEMHLLHYPKKRLYEPCTQPRIPVTEDMLERYKEYLASFDDPAERVKVQLAPLISDMEAFKAANPICCFEDFVRWHSPRDFILDDESTGTGHLSNRMMGEDNTWQQAWQQAKPRPVYEQKMLFNHQSGFTRALDEFENATASDLVILILPPLLKCVSLQLLEESRLYLPYVQHKLLAFCEKISKCIRCGDLENYLDAIKDLEQIENFVVCCNILYTHMLFEDDRKHTDIENYEIRKFIMSLVHFGLKNRNEAVTGGRAGAGYRVPIDEGLNGTIGSILKKIFFEPMLDANWRNTERRTFDQVLTGNVNMPYHRRQYVIRCQARHPAVGSRLLPQRMYGSVEKYGFRICLASSRDTILS